MRADHQAGRRRKPLTDWARRGALQLCRWPLGRPVIVVGDDVPPAIIQLRLEPQRCWYPYGLVEQGAA